MAGFFSSFRSRLIGCFLLVTALALLVPVLYVRPALHEGLLGDALERLAQEAVLVESMLGGPGAKVQNAGWPITLVVLENTDIRLTLMDDAGAVLLESSRKDGLEMENHADRPEVREAVQNGFGSATRLSTTLDKEFIYVAVRLSNGGILRLSTPFAGVAQRINEQILGIFLAAGVAIGLSLLLALFFAVRLENSLSGMVRVVEGIAQNNFTRRLHKVPGREFRPLAAAVNSMAQSIEDFTRNEADQKSQLEAILESMAEGVLVLGLTGRIRRVNRAFCSYFPDSSGAEGRQVVEVIPSPPLQDAVSALLQDPDGHGKTASLQINRQINGHEDIVFSVLLARPARNENPALGLVAVFRDITDLLRLSTVRRDFVANVSHELRTPLTAVQGYAETLLDMPDMPEQGRRFAQIIRKHGQFMSGMVDELLLLSRLESEVCQLERLTVNPQDALHNAMQMLLTEAQSKNIRIVETFQPNLRVVADASHLAQVFRNLLENACRYAPPGSSIMVRGHEYVEDDGKNPTMAVFSVSDQGPGIPLTDLSRVFERFYRVEKHRGASSGLGLSICRHILERQGGRIWAQSPSAEASTTFFFTLPLLGENV